MRTQDHIASDTQGHRVLEMATHGEDARDRAIQGDGQRRESSRTAQQLQLSRVLAGHRVIDRPHNSAIVGEHEIGNVTQPLQGVLGA